MRDIQPDHVSQLSLDLLLLGDLGEDAARAAKSHIEECLACRARYETACACYRHFERHVHPRTAPRVVGQARPGLETETRYPRWIAAVGTTVAAAAALLFWMRSQRPRLAGEGRAQPNDAPGLDVREQNGPTLAKGSPVFTVYARHEGRVFPVEKGERLKPGDALRFTADPGEYSFLMIASVDAATKATIYFPYLGSQSAPIPPRKHFTDDGSIVLDETPGPERIFALFSRRPVDAEIVKRALAAVGERGADGIRGAVSIDVPTDYEDSILIEK